MFNFHFHFYFFCQDNKQHDDGDIVIVRPFERALMCKLMMENKKKAN